MCERLAAFRFLTVAQMMRLGVTKNQRHLYAVLKAHLDAHKKPLFDKITFAPDPKTGALDALYFLTRRGAEALLDAGIPAEAMRLPASGGAFSKDYFHRRGCVELHISLALWAEREGARLVLYDTYFDRAGKGEDGTLRRKTGLTVNGKNFTADAVFIVATADGKEKLCAMELHLGADIARLESQVLTYGRAFKEGTLEKAHGYPFAARLLVVADTPSVIPRMQQRLGREPWAEQVFLKSFADTHADYAEGWARLTPALPVGRAF